jgi:hypothetical protein
MVRKTIIVPLALGAAALAAAAYAGNAGLVLGPSFQLHHIAYKGYYDGHKDVYLLTDVSDKAQASALHINYAPAMKPIKNLPPQYFVKGHAAAGQLTVFGSEPGESDYNPLWDEFFVTWKPGVKPELLVKDDQIKSLAKSKKLSLVDAHIVLNAPITRVGK